jgi:YggT family protein
MIIAVRFLMQLTRADYNNPLSQFVVKASNPLLIPLRKIVPGFAGTDFAALVLCFVLILLKLGLFKLIGFSDHIGGHSIPLTQVGSATLAALAFLALIELFFNLFIYSLVIQAILSWFNTGGYNPMTSVLSSITSPILTPIRRLIPSIGGLDLSVLVAIIGLQFAKLLTTQLFVQLIF